ncbi:hypothetical protein BKA62DRAFT_705573 [Auriculariales sp. MPI-PUGE-AT-0066]|nr:hypothetical protein BKA62DRAFT_705573 [Auriculariales sp. MPI-PUGE-AT-0066]
MPVIATCRGTTYALHRSLQTTQQREIRCIRLSVSKCLMEPSLVKYETYSRHDSNSSQLLRLSDDLLEHLVQIAFECAEPGHARNGRSFLIVAVSHVCQRLRRVMLERSRFWSHLDLHGRYSKERVAPFLTRSQNTCVEFTHMDDMLTRICPRIHALTMVHLNRPIFGFLADSQRRKILLPEGVSHLSVETVRFFHLDWLVGSRTTSISLMNIKGSFASFYDAIRSCSALRSLRMTLMELVGDVPLDNVQRPGDTICGLVLTCFPDTARQGNFVLVRTVSIQMSDWEPIRDLVDITQTGSDVRLCVGPKPYEYQLSCADGKRREFNVPTLLGPAMDSHLLEMMQRITTLSLSGTKWIPTWITNGIKLDDKPPVSVSQLERFSLNVTARSTDDQYLEPNSPLLLLSASWSSLILGLFKIPPEALIEIGSLSPKVLSTTTLHEALTDRHASPSMS